MSHTIHYYLSPISPFTCLAGNLLEREAPAEVVYHPFDIGRLFAATGGVPVPQRSPQRQAYRLAELGRIQKQRELWSFLVYGEKGEWRILLIDSCKNLNQQKVIRHDSF
ncbi:hypothetical protein XMD420_000423 [Marinobacterium sp. xm-d-420]|uniref:hypothetical protein n=1 Tax=Marinobacterium sp. xm-d-420 TaxID=2497737 RepID=UPI0015689410|nr:hypothetical protein [Marinobacterium sp. xm-d-420]NRP26839.1 hypothetical protein [Marinobacterium sp. xm-d-420]